MKQVNKTQFSTALVKFPARVKATRQDNGSVVYRDPKTDKVIALLVVEGEKTFRYLKEGEP